MGLVIEGVNQFYGQSHTLWDVSLSLRPGKVTCLMGRNGVGKTTLLKTIMGLVPAASGSARFLETELLGKRPDIRAPLGIGYVPQGREIFGQLTVEENLKIGLSARRDRLKVVPEQVYEFFPVLKEMRHRRGGDLSGGQQQQLAIGRAMVLEPKLLILDEPTEGIQPNIVQEIGEFIVRMCKELKMSVLLVEQKLPIVRKVAEDFAILEKGRVVALGEVDALTDDVIAKHLVV